MTSLDSRSDVAGTEVPVAAPAGPPPGPSAGQPATDPDLLAAFWDYERALGTNDVPALERWFAGGDGTLRSDGGATLVGSGHIAAFRRRRPPPGPRRVDRVHVRRVGADGALVVAETTRADGSAGAQTQLWERTVAGWRVTAAHVGSSPAARQELDDADRQRVWRVAPGPVLPTGAGSGVLAGVRLAVKDLFAVAGQVVGGGVPRRVTEGTTEPLTAPAVQALLDAGADVTGIAHTDELAFSLAGVTAGYGAVPNPAAPGCLTGGSSSGPAAAVAGGLADLGVGTDTAGSIRVPASCCGLWSLRPTHGAIPLAGVLPLAPSFDTVGLLAADPELLRRGAGVLLPARADAVPVQRLLWAPDLLAGLAPDVRAAFEAALTALAGRTGSTLGAADPLAERIDGWFPAFRAVQCAEAWRSHGEFVQRSAEELMPDVVARFRVGRDVGPEREAACRAVLSKARRELAVLVPPGTALVLPAASGPALEVDLAPDRVDAARVASLRLTCLASLAGLPAVAVPTMRVGGRPMALSVLGCVGSDHDLLDLLDRPAPWEAR